MDKQNLAHNIFDLCGELESIAAALEDITNALQATDSHIWRIQQALERYDPKSGTILKGDFDLYRSLYALTIYRLSGLIAETNDAIKQGYEAHQRTKTEKPQG